MRTVVAAAVLGVLAWAGGCASGTGPAERVILFVPGASGDGPWYGGLKRALREHDPAASVATCTWGAPVPLFAVNFNNKSIHGAAERKLAERLRRVLADGPARRVDLVAHSAGCGVVLGALARSDPAVTVGDVVLLAPSVSPGFDLAPALARVDGTLHVFHSERDTLFLSWRTGTFGTYDGVKTRAAGNAGFDLDSLSPVLAARVVQHPHDPRWRRLGNDGGHYGALARPFVRAQITPLLRTAQSSGANRH